jgi:plastocyanin
MPHFSTFYFFTNPAFTTSFTIHIQPMALYTQSLVAVAAIAGNLLPLCVAQDITATPTATASQPAQTHTISVGIDHKFKPEVILADVGDNIDFQFFPPNHSVVRAEYEFPCIPYEMTGRGKVGFFSGFHPVDAILDEVSGVRSSGYIIIDRNVSHRRGQFKSMTPIPYLYTVLLLVLVSPMEWSP